MGAERPMIVGVYLRGAADGLSLVVPHTEARYHALRPTLGVPRPDDTRSPEAERAIDLDGRFALHPSLSGLAPLYRAGELAVVHAVGSDDDTRSHFEAQDQMEHGCSRMRPVPDGWLARHLRARPGPRTGGLSAVAIGTSAPESLRGTPVSVLRSAEEVRLRTGDDAALVRALAALHAGAGDPRLPLDAELREAGRGAAALIERLRAPGSLPPSTVRYPEGDLGAALREVARLSRGDLGVEVACVDHGGWDTHFVQGQLLPGLARELGDALRAFREDLGERMASVVVVCMTEFGRRAHENTSLGTDHGRAGVMFVLGGGVRGGRVVTDWPGLDEDKLEPPGDLKVTIDYREVLAELLSARFGTGEAVFPGVAPRGLGLFTGA